MAHDSDGPTLYTNGTSQRRPYIVQGCRTVAAAMRKLRASDDSAITATVLHCTEMEHHGDGPTFCARCCCPVFAMAPTVPHCEEMWDRHTRGRFISATVLHFLGRSK